MLYYTILYFPILSYPILSYTILYYPILSYTILYYPILYYSMLYYTIQRVPTARGPLKEEGSEFPFVGPGPLLTSDRTEEVPEQSFWLLLLLMIQEA